MIALFVLYCWMKKLQRCSFTNGIFTLVMIVGGSGAVLPAKEKGILYKGIGKKLQITCRIDADKNGIAILHRGILCE